MKVLVGCEFSGIVRDAFLKLGHDAISCDLLDSETKGPHYKGDIKDILYDGFDLAIFHPPCTYLCSSGARWWKNRQKEQQNAIEFVKLLWNAPIEKIVIENPIGILSTKIRKPDQIIQPWQFGHQETKSTCLWLKNLPKLVPTKIETIRNRNLTPSGQSNVSESKDRWKIRSRTYAGIGAAFATQYGKL